MQANKFLTLSISFILLLVFILLHDQPPRSRRSHHTPLLSFCAQDRTCTVSSAKALPGAFPGDGAAPGVAPAPPLGEILKKKSMKLAM